MPLRCNIFFYRFCFFQLCSSLIWRTLLKSISVISKSQFHLINLIFYITWQILRARSNFPVSNLVIMFFAKLLCSNCCMSAHYSTQDRIFSYYTRLQFFLNMCFSLWFHNISIFCQIENQTKTQTHHFLREVVCS